MSELTVIGLISAAGAATGSVIGAVAGFTRVIELAEALPSADSPSVVLVDPFWGKVIRCVDVSDDEVLG